MDGLIPMVFKAIKKNKTRRQYECLSSGAAQSYNAADFNSNIIAHQNSMYVTRSGEKMEPGHGHRRHKSVGDFYAGYSAANGGGFGGGGGGGGSPPPRAKQLVRFRSHRMFSCVTGAS